MCYRTVKYTVWTASVHLWPGEFTGWGSDGFNGPDPLLTKGICRIIIVTNKFCSVSSVQFSSVQDCIYALGKVHMRSTPPPSLRRFPQLCDLWNISNVCLIDNCLNSLVLSRKIVSPGDRWCDVLAVPRWASWTRLLTYICIICIS